MPNVDDLFPRDPTEWHDDDGDGIGNNEDPDDDNDGILDNDDLGDPGDTGLDTDGDGTPDTYDLDPGSPTESRFVVEAESPIGASARIISDALIPLGATRISADDIGDDPVLAVAVSPAIDFEIQGSSADFESARITIPIDPELASLPESVEVWWFNEDLGLWVPDGTDLAIDAVTATVSVTVDHFSLFIALRAGATPAIAPPDAVACGATGVDVVFLVDVSASLEYGFINRAVIAPAADPKNASSLDPAFTARQEVVAEIVPNLVSQRDRVALMSFASDTELVTSLETASLGDILSQVSQLVSEPRANTSIDVALRDVFAQVLVDEGRPRAVVLVSDGAFDTPDSIPAFDSIDVPVHTVQIGDADPTAMEQIAFRTGGVASLSVEDSGDGSFDSASLSTLNTTLIRTGNSGENDSDKDSLTDCQELLGLPLVDGLNWLLPGETVGAYDPDRWVKTNPFSADSDNDFLWDSQELRPVNLLGASNLSASYARVLAAGITEVFVYRGDPNELNDPVNAEGEVTRRDYSFEPALPRIADAMAVRAAEINDELNEISLIPATELSDAQVRLVPEIASLAVHLNPQTEINDRLSAVRAGLFWGSTPRIDAVLPRLQALFSEEEAVFNPNAFLNLFITEQIDLVEEASALRDQPGLSLTNYLALEVQLDNAMLELARRILSERRTEPQFGPSDPADLVALINRLQSNYHWQLDQEDPNSFSQPLNLRAATRLVILRYAETGAFDAHIELMRRTLERIADGTIQNMPVNRVELLRLEFQAATNERLDRIKDESLASEFLDEDQLEAFNYLAELFADQEVVVDRSPNARVTVHTPTDVNAAGELKYLPIVFTVDQPSVFWPEISSHAEANLTDDEFKALELMFDDLALSTELGSGWTQQQQFSEVDRNLDPAGDRSRDLSEFGGATRPPVSDAPSLGDAYVERDWLDDNHPGLVTLNDMLRFQAFADLRFLVDTNADLLELSDDLIVNKGDIDSLAEFVGPGEISRTEADRFVELAIGFDLLDKNFDLDAFVSLMQKIGLGLTFVAGGVYFVAGRSAAQLFFAAAAAAEVPVFAVQVAQGKFREAGLTAAFLTFDSIEAARAIVPLLNRGRLGSELLDDAAEVTGETLRNVGRLDGAPADQAGRFDDFAASLDVRVADAGIDTSSGSELAFLQATTKFRNRQDIVATGFVDVGRAQGYVDAYYGDLYRALSPDEQRVFDAVLAAMAVPGAPEAYARWGNRIFSDVNAGSLRDDLLEFGESCRIAASFGGATLVVMADGSRRRIDTVTVGDQVLAWDEDTATTVVETVTATLPHTDTLYTAEFSDGSHVQVTEDHVFFNATADAWMELHYVEPGDQLLSPNGDHVGLIGIDWYSAVNASAYDLSVSDEHNYFITADGAAEPVLVHNMTEGSFCGVKIKNLDIVDDLLAVEKVLQQSTPIGIVRASLGRLSEAEVDFFLDTVAAASRSEGADFAATIASNSSVSELVTARLLDRAAGNARSQAFVRRVLGAEEFDWVDNYDKVAEKISAGPGAQAFAGESEEFFAAQVLEARGLSVQRNPFEGFISNQAPPNLRTQGDAWVGDGLLVYDFKKLRANSDGSTLAGRIVKDADDTRFLVDLTANNMSSDQAAGGILGALRNRSGLEYVEAFGAAWPDGGVVRVVWDSANEPGFVRIIQTSDSNFVGGIEVDRISIG